MSKKSRARRGAPAGRAASNDKRIETQAAALVDQVLSDLWAAIASGDPLRAELETASCMAVPFVLAGPDSDEAEAFISKVLVEGAVHKDTPDSAALLRLLMSLGTPATRREASQALAELTGEGVYPPDWVTEIGKATPGQAWRRYDLFGDDEAIAVTFSYGESEHGILVQVDLTEIPVATGAGVSSNTARLIEAITADNDEFDRSERIGLAEARRHLLAPLDRADREPDPDMSTSTVASLPIVRSRVRRLPAGDGQPGPVYTAADRAAAVENFLTSPVAAEAVAADEEATRFWAEVLTGYSSRIPGEPPGQVGPGKLAHILLGYVPNFFALSSAQRAHLEPAVTAWLRWSADRRDLGESATKALMEGLAPVLSRFGLAYDDPEAVALRGYTSGLSASDADVSQLFEKAARRLFALPMPARHRPPNLADPADRRRLVQDEFGECTPPDGMTSEEFVDAAYRVIEDMWRAEDGQAFQAASRLSAEGLSRHDAIHQLAGTPMTR